MIKEIKESEHVGDYFIRVLLVKDVRDRGEIQCEPGARNMFYGDIEYYGVFMKKKWTSLNILYEHTRNSPFILKHGTNNILYYLYL